MIDGIYIKDIQLLPCPFCGNRMFFDLRTAEKYKWVECRCCEAHSPMVVSKDDNDAIEAWNNRYIEDLEYSDDSTHLKYGFSSPVAPGDMVWVLADCIPKQSKSEWIHCTRIDERKTLQARVVNVHITKSRSTFKLAISAKVHIEYPDWCSDSPNQYNHKSDEDVMKEYIKINFPFGAMGKTVFYTKVEAEKALNSIKE